MKGDDPEIAKAVEEFQGAVTEAAEAVKTAIRAFAAWCPAWMPEDTREKWESANEDPYPGDDYMRGYAAALEAIKDGAEFFLREEL